MKVCFKKGANIVETVQQAPSVAFGDTKYFNKYCRDHDYRWKYNCTRREKNNLHAGGDVELNSSS